MIYKLAQFAKSYQIALRKHLSEGGASNLMAAHRLGKRAMKLGLGALDLAMLHEEALLLAVRPNSPSQTDKDTIPRCVAFFAEAAKLLDDAHRGAKEANEHLNVLLETLTQRTHELALSNQELKQEINQEVSNEQELHRMIAETQRLVEISVETVHCFAHDLRPTLLDDLGLIPALKALLNGFMKQSGIRVTLAVYAGVEKLSWDVRTVLYRVVQEALSNVGYHSQASLVTVRLVEAAGIVGLEIHDNGCGFAVAEMNQSDSSRRLGLLGMRERVEMVGGTFVALSVPGQETTLRIEIPASSKMKTTKAPAVRGKILTKNKKALLGTTRCA